MYSSSDAGQQHHILVALGFCGADDSVHPNQLALIANAYPNVEFGILFRPDKKGAPRYASPEFVENLGKTARNMTNKTGTTMKLAAHLCGSYVHDVLEYGSKAGTDFLEYLVQMGFTRVQINATAVNGVDTELYLTKQSSIDALWQYILDFRNLEFILQRNQETEFLWKGIEQKLEENHKRNAGGAVVSNVSMLVDESKGTGVLTKTWPTPTNPHLYKTGYAGGLGPDNVSSSLTQILKVLPPDTSFWIDMESSIRSIKNDKDVFDLDKCFAVIQSVCDMGLMEQPDYLLDK